MRRALSALLVLCAIGALCAEALLRAAHDERDEGFPPGLFVAEARRGYALAPRFQARVHRIHYFDVVVNEAGYRDRPWNDAAEAALPRILMVGSSALFGVGVQAGERLTERLERHMEGAWRVLNAGVYGYGPPQALATVEKECDHLKPRLVLYAHEYKLTRADFLRADARTVVDGQLVTRSQGSSAPTAAPVAHSAPPSDFWSFPRLRGWLWRRGWHPTQLAESLYGRERLPEARVRARYLATGDAAEFPADGPHRAAQTVRAMAAAAAACGARFAVILLPGPYEHRYALEEPASAALKAELAGGPAIVDLRRALAGRPALMLSGMDYFDAAALDGFAAVLQPALAPLLAAGRGG